MIMLAELFLKNIENVSLQAENEIWKQLMNQLSLNKKLQLTQ